METNSHFPSDNSSYPEEDEEKELSADERLVLAQELQYKAILLALHQLYCSSLTPSEVVLFEELLCETFKEVNVSNLLEENIRNRESRALSVKLDLDDDENESSTEKGKRRNEKLFV